MSIFQSFNENFHSRNCCATSWNGEHCRSECQIFADVYWSLTLSHRFAWSNSSRWAKFSVEYDSVACVPFSPESRQKCIQSLSTMPLFCAMWARYCGPTNRFCLFLHHHWQKCFATVERVTGRSFIITHSGVLSGVAHFLFFVCLYVLTIYIVLVLRAFLTTLYCLFSLFKDAFIS